MGSPSMQYNSSFGGSDHGNITMTSEEEGGGGPSNMTRSLVHLDSEFPPDYALPINGYLIPPLILFTIITNSLVCIVLLKPHMRSPTNMLLVAMAVSDTLTGLTPVPQYLYFYTFGYHREWVPYEWCVVNSVLGRALPTIFHTASIWLTLALAAQRYICVCHSIFAKRWCTQQNVLRTIAVIYFLSFVVHISTFLDTQYYPTTDDSFVNPKVGITVRACKMVQHEWFAKNHMIFYNIYMWFRIVFIHIFPCISLVILNALLIKTMKEAKKRRAQLLRQNKKNECKKLKDSSCTTMMMVAVVGVFLTVEIPAGIFILFYAVVNTVVSIADFKVLFPIITLILNFFILLSYPVNFFIYCGMSRQFRETFKRLFLRGSQSPVEREHSQYMTLANENGRCNVNMANTTSTTTSAI
ncbi:sex peptide receptor-like [Lineus longissimus]|uniref:sex peptide receptor-like n=1 Tax=Lineus longissimus TaxID=88925 RepID=UPI00315D22F3